MRQFVLARSLREKAAVAALVAGLALGCGDILEVTDPDIILEARSRSAAVALANGTERRLAQAVTGTQGPDALFLFAGLLTDEWRSGDTFVQRNNQDQRIFDPANTFNAGPFRNLSRVRTQAKLAIEGLREFLPGELRLIGLQFAYTAYVHTLIGEHYCNGTPISAVEGGEVVFGQPLSNDSVLRRAIAEADSAMAIVAGDTTSAGVLRPAAQKVRWLAQVVKGRALLDRGIFLAAAAAVAGVPDTFSYKVEHSINTTSNQIFALNNGAKRYTMVDFDGGNGIDYILANDPRLPRRTGTSTSTDLIFDSSFPLFVTRQGIYGTESSVPIANGVEARLIEAEAQLQTGGDRGQWLAVINALRTNVALYPPIEATGTSFTRGPVLGALPDPASDSVRIDIHFRERAFWFFSTGHRLGDMRRLVRQYGRNPGQVYPVGGFFKGGSYGEAINMSVPQSEQNNPNFTQCLDVNP